MEHTWKPNGWLSIIYGLILQPFTFLYVNKAKLFWFYLILAVLVSFIQTKLHLAPNKAAWYQNIYFTWFFILICPLHAYLLAKKYDKAQIRKWYASWWSPLICCAVFFTISALGRTFFYEPFSIPAKSMSPTFNPGEQILVNKKGYGNYRLLGIQVYKSEPSKSPQRGDIIVFQYPLNPTIDYVKRVIGLPGDKVIYRNKSIYIQRPCTGESNECINSTEAEKEYKFTQSEGGSELQYYRETLGPVSYDIKLSRNREDLFSRYFDQVGTKPGEWIVPEKHYFVLGDNRDNSLDSRYWGFVPESNVVGKVDFKW